MHLGQSVLLVDARLGLPSRQRLLIGCGIGPQLSLRAREFGGAVNRLLVRAC
jgi:hypothetical protein